MAKEKICGVYKIENLINRKVYIGSSIDIARRKRVHLRLLNQNKHENDYLQKSWNKYGKDNFLFLIIEEVCDVESLLNKEQYWINYYHSSERDNGYNLSPTAGNMLHFKHSEESRKKISQAHLGSIPWNKGYGEYIKGDKSPLYGKKLSEETKQKIRLVKLNKKVSESTKNKMYDKSIKGELSLLSILTDSDVVEIKILLEYTNLYQKDIGIIFGVDQRTISAIKTGRSWKHIEISNISYNYIITILDKYETEPNSMYLR